MMARWRPASWLRLLRNRRGFVLMTSLAVMTVVLMIAVTTQGVAMRDLQFASRSLMKTRAYLNARSGIEAALTQLASQPEQLQLSSREGIKVPEGDYSVEIASEQAAAFEPLLSGLDPAERVYLIDSLGQVPIRGGAKNYTVRIQAVVRTAGGQPQIVVWSETSGAPGSNR